MEPKTYPFRKGETSTEKTTNFCRFNMFPFPEGTVDGKSPKQPPGMYKTPVNNGDKLPTSTGACRISSINR